MPQEFTPEQYDNRPRVVVDLRIAINKGESVNIEKAHDDDEGFGPDNDVEVMDGVAEFLGKQLDRLCKEVKSIKERVRKLKNEASTDNPQVDS